MNPYVEFEKVELKTKYTDVRVFFRMDFTRILAMDFIVLVMLSRQNDGQ